MYVFFSLLIIAKIHFSISKQFALFKDFGRPVHTESEKKKKSEKKSGVFVSSASQREWNANGS